MLILLFMILIADNDYIFALSKFDTFPDDVDDF